MKTVTVFPTKASALNVKHPQGPKMAVGGVIWPKDSFTGRRLRDRSVTEDKAKAYAPAAAAAAPVAAAPASAPAPSPEPTSTASTTATQAAAA